MWTPGLKGLRDKQSPLHHILVSYPKPNNQELGYLKGTNEQL